MRYGPLVQTHLKRKTGCKERCGVPELPRFGLRLFLPKQMGQITYFGLGPVENYIDKKNASYHGLFLSSVKEMHEDYLRPQENGSRSDCDFVTIEGGDLSLSVAADKTFSFHASEYTQEELTEKAHNYELIPSGYTEFCVDYTTERNRIRELWAGTSERIYVCGRRIYI